MPAPTVPRPLAQDAGPSARPEQARGEICGVVDCRYHPRPRAAGGRVPGIAARDRISRSCAVRFFSVNASGEIAYVNATLANWLDYDLAEIGSGGLKLTDIVSGDGAALLTSVTPVPGEVTTEVFDIDLRMRTGKTMPARLYHKLAFGADGAPGASRTLVISRARDERADPQRAAEVRFMRFFDHTPMAIATVDSSGAIVRANARFAKLSQGLGADGAAGKSISAPSTRATATFWSRRSPGSTGAGRHRAGRGDARRRQERWASSSSPRSRRTSARRRPRSSTCWRRRSAGRWRTRSTSRRRWTWSASSPAASRMTSTTCCPRS